MPKLYVRRDKNRFWVCMPFHLFGGVEVGMAKGKSPAQAHFKISMGAGLGLYLFFKFFKIIVNLKRFNNQQVVIIINKLKIIF